MRYIYLEIWPRSEHFRMFSAWDHPHFNMSANVDLTAFYPVVKQSGISFTMATVYIVTRAANAIPEFRYRIRAGEMVEHELIHPSTAMLVNEDLFTFCMFDYTEDFSLFETRAAEQIASVKEHPSLENEPGRDDLLYITSIPWASFTSFIHPLNLNPVDRIFTVSWMCTTVLRPSPTPASWACCNSFFEKYPLPIPHQYPFWGPKYQALCSIMGLQ